MTEPITQWIVQDLGPRREYPKWHSYCIRDAKTNVHLATVGDMDRYFEEKTGEHAKLMASAPELKKENARLRAEVEMLRAELKAAVTP